MPRRKKIWWKPRINTKSLQSVLALIFILLGFLFLLTSIASIFGVNNPLHQFTYFLFGLTAILFPFNLFLIGLALTKIKHEIAQPRILWGSLLLTLSINIFIGSFSTSYAGWLGGWLSNNFSSLVTPIGCMLTSLVFIFIALLVIFNASINEFWTLISKYWQPVLKFYHQTLKPFVLQIFASKDTGELTQTSSELEEQRLNKKTRLEKKEDTESVIEIVDEQAATTTSRITSTAIGSQDTTQVKQTYTPPPLSLLSDSQPAVSEQDTIEKNAQIIEKTLDNFGIRARIVEVNLGPSVTQFAIDLAEGTKTSKITGLQNELALALASPTGSVRIESPIPGKRLIGIEVPNSSLSLVFLKSILESKKIQSHTSKLAIALGEDVAGKPVVADLEKWPHVLIAGQTGSGKSVLLHSMINSMLFRTNPNEVRFILVDPKRVELTSYQGIPHLQTPVIVDVEKTINAFKWAVEEMEKRYRLFQQLSARNINDFNQKTDTETLPNIVIVVDELADLMTYAANEMETLITRIAQKARATGIFMILATQRPSVNVITGLIKANIPSRIALNVTSGTDSRVIIDMIGAEKLLGRGDMLYLPPEAGKPKRIQGVFVSDEEIQRVVEYLRQFPSPYSTSMESFSTIETIDRSEQAPKISQPVDNKLLDAVQVILNHDKASASLLQRRLKIGYARAARMLDELEEIGIVGEQNGTNPRDVYREVALNYLNQFKSP